MSAPLRSALRPARQGHGAGRTAGRRRTAHSQLGPALLQVAGDAVRRCRSWSDGGSSCPRTWSWRRRWCRGWRSSNGGRLLRGRTCCPVSAADHAGDDDRDLVRRRDGLGCRGGSRRGGDGRAPVAVGIAVGGAAGAALDARVGRGVLPGSYRDIVEVLQDAVHPMRAHDLCAALGLSTDKSKVEGFRSKLKRLVEGLVGGGGTGTVHAVPGSGNGRGCAGAGRVFRRAPPRRCGVGLSSLASKVPPVRLPGSESPMTAGYAAAAAADPFDRAASFLTSHRFPLPSRSSAPVP